MTSPVPLRVVGGRNVIFLSHAMPEDTEFAVWLSIQLANAGYQVWSEATRLIGGERFWTDIEEAFDTVIGKTVVVVSPITRLKSGVLDEVERATATAEAYNIPHDKFLLPITLAPLNRREMPIQLGRQNAIPFHPSWAEGLARLMKVLAKEDFPKTAQPAAVGAWVADWFEGRHQVINRDELHMSNTLGLSRLPPTMRMYNLSVAPGALKSVANALPISCAVHDNLLLTFCRLDEIQELLPDCEIRTRAEVETDRFLDGRPGQGAPNILARDASNHTANILRQAWDRHCSNQGLVALNLSSGRTGWFLPAGTAPDRYIYFDDLDGRRRKKVLYGTKTKQAAEGRVVDMHWHFAPRVWFSLGRSREEVIVEPHVAFTTDGRSLLGDAERAHKIRRSFCKLWFNEQWRTLHLAYFAHLSDADGFLDLPVARDQMCEMDVRPERFLSPVGFDLPVKKTRPGAPVTEADAVPDEDPDADDGGDEWVDMDGPDL